MFCNLGLDLRKCMMEDSYPQNLLISVKDVYEIAAEIASGFEKIIDCCDSEDINPLISKVICSLEYLESCVTKYECAEKELSDIKEELALLASKIAANLKEELKLENDLEQVEESWHREELDLKFHIRKLQEENKHLQDLVNDYERSEQLLKEKFSDECLFEDLRNVIASLTTRLEEKKSELKKQACEHDFLHSKIGNLNETNKKLSQRFSLTKIEVKHLYEENADLVFQLQSHKKLLQSLQFFHESSRMKINLKQNIKPCELSIQKLVEDFPSAFGSDRESVQIHDSLFARISRLEQELDCVKNQNQNLKLIIGNLTTKDDLHGSFSKTNAIRHLFQLFLGVLSFEPQNFLLSHNEWK